MNLTLFGKTILAASKKRLLFFGTIHSGSETLALVFARDPLQILILPILVRLGSAQLRKRKHSWLVAGFLTMGVSFFRGGGQLHLRCSFGFP